MPETPAQQTTIYDMNVDAVQSWLAPVDLLLHSASERRTTLPSCSCVRCEGALRRATEALAATTKP